VAEFRVSACSQKVPWGGHCLQRGDIIHDGKR
jgi:hypothetical protein